jgi:hypothetical protein
MAYGGTWNSADPPVRSGVFINIDTVATPRVAADANGVVGLVVTADWGPENQIVDIDSDTAATAVFHTGGNASWAIKQALRGEGIAGRSGASVVKVYRAATSSSAKASIILNNTSAANALTLTAKYTGTRGNNFKVTVKTSAPPDQTTHLDILIYEGTVLRESYVRLAKSSIAAMAAAINATSNLVTATVVTDGVALATVTTQSLTGGNSGSSLTSAEHVAAMSAFEATGQFSVIAPVGLTDNTIRATYKDWANRLNTEGRLFHLVVGGAASETVADAIARSQAMDSPYVVNIFGDINIDGTSYSSAAMTARVAGIIANCGYQRSITFAQIPEATMTSPPSASAVESAVRAKVVPFWSDGVAVRLQRGQTTLTTPTESNPAQFASLLFMRKVQQSIRELDEIGTAIISSGQFVNTPNDRDALLGLYAAKIKDLEARNVLTPGAGSVHVDDSYNNTGESLHLIYKLTIAPGIEQILGRMTISS